MTGKLPAMIQNYAPCEYCQGSGIWKGEFHSGVCAQCDGLGLLSDTHEKVGVVEAIDLLKTRGHQLSHDLVSLFKYVTQEDIKTMDSIFLINKKAEEGCVKTKPSYFRPANLNECGLCNGTGIYSGIVSSGFCVSCQGSGYSIDEGLPIYEVVSLLSFNNKIKKRKINYLLDIDGVREKKEKDNKKLVDDTYR